MRKTPTLHRFFLTKKETGQKEIKPMWALLIVILLFAALFAMWLLDDEKEWD
jgi:hypothetical protein